MASTDPSATVSIEVPERPRATRIALVPDIGRESKL